MLKHLPVNLVLDEVVINTIRMAGFPREAVYKGLTSRKYHHDFATFDYVSSTKFSPDNIETDLELFLLVKYEKVWIHWVDVNIFGKDNFKKAEKLKENALKFREHYVFLFLNNAAIHLIDKPRDMSFIEKDRTLLSMTFLTYEELRKAPLQLNPVSLKESDPELYALISS